MLRNGVVWILKTLLVWIALLVGNIVGGMLVGDLGTGPYSKDGPLSSGIAFFTVNGLNAALLAGLAEWARIRGFRLALFLFLVLVSAQTLLMQIETIFFSAHVALPLHLLPRIVAGATTSAAIAAAVAASLFRPTPSLALEVSGLSWKIPTLAMIYVGLYFAAGYCIAWQYPALRSFYGDGADIAMLPLAALQFARGMLWAWLAWWVLCNLTGPIAWRAFLLALTLAIFSAVQLLYPNTYMPWTVRLPHLIEVGLCNALFGVIATLILGHKPASQPRR